jgi:hypothetical protein
MLMMSLVLHGAVLMLPIPSDLDKPKPPKKQEQVKITQLPRTRSSPKLSPQSSSKPNPQYTLQPSLSTPRDRPTRPEPVTTRQEPIVSLLPLPESSSPLQQQSKYKKEEPQQQLTEQPRRSESTKEPTSSQSPVEPTPSQSPVEPTPSQSPVEPTPSQSPVEPTPSQSPIEPTPSQSPIEPTPSQSTEKAKVNKEGTGGSYSESLNKEPSIFIKAALEQVKHKYNEEKFNEFKIDQDINKLTEAKKFQDAKGSPDSRFEFLKKAISPLTTQDVTSSLQTQLSILECGFNKIGTYGGGSVYEVTKGDFKRYLIFVPGKDEQGDLTAIVVSKDYPRE